MTTMPCSGSGTAPMTVRVQVTDFTSRRPIDLQRVASALCPGSRAPRPLLRSTS